MENMEEGEAMRIGKFQYVLSRGLFTNQIELVRY